MPNRGWTRTAVTIRRTFLNPSFTGMPTRAHTGKYIKTTMQSLNPSSNGIPVLGSCSSPPVHPFSRCLNPSFTGIPARGQVTPTFNTNSYGSQSFFYWNTRSGQEISDMNRDLKGLNPSFTGIPARGCAL